MQVLEACLDHTSASMAAEVQKLEPDSTAALDALAQRVTAGNLGAVRRVKNRMVRLNTRVETVRTLLEKYLADDADLAELHLTGQRCAATLLSGPLQAAVNVPACLFPLRCFLVNLRTQAVEGVAEGTSTAAGGTLAPQHLRLCASDSCSISVVYDVEASKCCSCAGF